MTDKKSDLKKVTLYGRWLEIVFRENASGIDYKRAFIQAYKIINVAPLRELFDISDDRNYTLRLLEFIASKGREEEYLRLAEQDKSLIVKEYGIDPDEYVDYVDLVIDKKDSLEVYLETQKYWFEQLLADANRADKEKYEIELCLGFDLLDPRNKKFFAQSQPDTINSLNPNKLHIPVNEYQDFFNKPEKFCGDMLLQVTSFFAYKKDAKDWLKQVAGRSVPLEFSFHSIPHYDEMLQLYNEIQTAITYEPNEGFSSQNQFIKDRSYDLLDVIFCRIFVDFLLAGGLGYFGFCGYCGNFWVAERKRRKKFCSDICRTNNQRPK